MTRSEAGDAFDIRVPFVTVPRDPGAALRLDTLLGTPHEAGELRDDDPLTNLRRSLSRHCDPRRRSHHAFLDRYFRFVADHVDDHHDELAAKLEPFGDLFQCRDWAYSAPMPLPRAHLHAPGSEEPFGPDTLIPVDFAFWIGGNAIAVEIQGGSTPPAATTTRHERLRRSGIRIVAFSNDTLLPANQSGFENALPDDLRWFWRDLTLPTGPLKPAALDVAAAEI
jgi:hypothetical protein